MKIEKLPLEMSLIDLKNILGDLGFDPKLFSVKIMAEENNNAAIVMIVEDGPSFTTKVTELKINGIPVECSILGEEEISKLKLDQKPSAGFYVNIQFCKFDEIPTQDEIEKKIIQVGLESPKNWRKSGPSSFSFSMMVAGEEEDQKQRIKTALKGLGFGENISVSVKEVKRKAFSIKVTRGEPSIRLTNLPPDCDNKKLRAAIKKNSMFEFEIKNCKDGAAEISYTAREIDLLNKLDGMKIGDNVVKVVGETADDNYVVPDDWTEAKIKEVLGIEKLVPLEIQIKGEKLALLFKPTKETMPKIIQELAKLRPEPEEPVEEEEVEVKVEEKEVKPDEDMKEKEVKDDSGEKEEAPQMIDGKPVVFASMDIREKKKAQAQAQAEETKQGNDNNVKETKEM